MKTNEYLQIVQKGLEAQPFAKMMGFQAEDAGEGYAVVSCARRPDMLQQTGIFHGGAAAAICEAAAGYAALTVLPENQSVVGVEYKINFLRALTADKVLAKAQVIKRGRQLVIVEVDAYNAGSEKTAVKMILTASIVEKG